mgnify:CR=1 FL=1
MPLGEVKRFPRNPKQHDLGLLHRSLSRFGFVNPLIVNEATGELLAGHGRLDTLEQRKAEGKPPPSGIEARDGEWLVPVVRGVSLKGKEAEAFSVADNQTTIIGGWSEQALADILQEIDLDGVGFDAEDLERLLQDLQGPDLGPELDERIAEGMALCVCEKCGNEHARVRK